MQKYVSGTNPKLCRLLLHFASNQHYPCQPFFLSKFLLHLSAATWCCLNVWHFLISFRATVLSLAISVFMGGLLVATRWYSWTMTLTISKIHNGICLNLILTKKYSFSIFMSSLCNWLLLTFYSSVAFCINSFVVIKTTMGLVCAFWCIILRDVASNREIFNMDNNIILRGVPSNIKIFNRIHNIWELGFNDIPKCTYVCYMYEDLRRILMGCVVHSVYVGREQTEWYCMVYTISMVWYGWVW